MKSQLKHLISGKELTKKNLEEILTLAEKIKKNPSVYAKAMLGKKLVLLFEKPSFRTRLSFSLAIQGLGGICVESTAETRKSEEPKDIIRVLNHYCDFVMVRTHEEKILEEMVMHAEISIINGLSAKYHPCQILADLLTLKEKFSSLENLTVAYVGDGNNILHSLLLMAPLLKIKIHYACPAMHQPTPSVLARCDTENITSFSDPKEAVDCAQAVYTDVWTSMGFQNSDNENIFKNFQVNETLMSLAAPNAVFMHCMPMVRGKEVSLSLPDAANSVIFQQSENRLYVQQSLLLFLQQ